MTSITVRRYTNELVTIFQLTLYCIVWHETRGWLWMTYQSKMPKSVPGLLQYSKNEAWQVAVEKGAQRGLRIRQISDCVTVASLRRSCWSFSISILEYSATLYFATQCINPYPTVFPYGNGMVLHFYQQQESSTTKTVHKVINKGLKAYV